MRQVDRQVRARKAVVKKNLNTTMVRDVVKIGICHQHHVEGKVQDRDERKNRAGSGSGAEAEKIVRDIRWREKKGF